MQINFRNLPLFKLKKSSIISIAIGLLISIVSLFYSNYLAKEIEIKERKEINLWAQAISMQNHYDIKTRFENQIMMELIKNLSSIPLIVTDEYLNVKQYQHIDQEILSDPKELRNKLKEMSSGGRAPIDIIMILGGEKLTVFYGKSQLLKSLSWYPLLQLSIIIIVVMFAMMTYKISKDNQQNKVWVGMSKETAHQLGTPTSSLLGWIEYLRGQHNVDSGTLDEMEKDIDRLKNVADRFSKIGSTTQLTPNNVIQATQAPVDYFRVRLPKNVTLNYSCVCDESSEQTLVAMINTSLYEWVIENLIKNSLDALNAKGVIDVVVSETNRWVIVDITDSGKGIPKANWQQIFLPGFTTKTRGWGLGLSLSRRIIEDYHTGRIFVLNSEPDKGTTIRITLNKAHLHNDALK